MSFASGCRVPAFLLTSASLMGLLGSCDGGGESADPVDQGEGPAAQAAPAVELDLAAAPNVILISIDTLRSDHLGTYGHVNDTSPRMDALGAAGAVFEECTSSTSWTLPAHAAMLTGLSDLVHGCTDTDRTLAPSRITIAERLGAVGYETGGFWSGPYLHPTFGLGQGFDTWVDCTSYAAINNEVAESEGAIEGEEVWNRANHDITNPTVLKGATSWLQENGDERFFLFLHLWDCHFDFIPPAPYDTMFDPDYTGTMTGQDFFTNPDVNPGMDPRDLAHLKALYDGEIRWTDDHIGQLLDALEEQGLAENTLVVLTSDHGTAFFEHGQRAHRNGLFDELIHVPLIMRLPTAIPAGTRSSTQVRLIDVVPTILDLVGLPHPADVMGRSLRPAFGGDLEESVEPAVSELYTLGIEQRSYRRRDHKLIMDWGNPSDVRSFVVDLSNDPGELRPLASASLPVSQAALADRKVGFDWLKAWQAALPVDRSTSEIPPDILRQLQHFGYVGDSEDE